MFTDRTDAGERLAAELDSRAIEADVVLGVPRGGLPVAGAVAERLGAPLDVVVAKKIALPHNQEYAVGAVTPEGEAWYDEATIRQLGVDESELAAREAAARERAAEKRDAFWDGREPVDVSGKRVVVVDDGVATGATMRACVRALVDAGAERVTVAVPVASPTSVPELQVEADEVVALRTPERFRAVGQFYDSFDQLSTAEAVEYLETSAVAS
jgi:predicted phosphoribosyltransferase